MKKTLSYEVVTIKNIAGAVTIPAKVGNLPVSRINTYALYGSTLTRVVNISNGIDKISTQAFYGSSNLKIVNIPSSTDAVNYRAFYDVNNCQIYIESSKVPTDWDSSWYYNIKGHTLNAQASYSSNAEYLYKTVGRKIYLVEYLGTLSTKTPIIIPEKIDGKTVSGVCSYCYKATASCSSSNRYIFVIPKSITAMEEYAIYVTGSYYGYSNIFLEFDEASEIPTTWNSNWF